MDDMPTLYPLADLKVCNNTCIIPVTLIDQTVSQNCSHAHSKHWFFVGFDLFICPYNYNKLLHSL